MKRSVLVGSIFLLLITGGMNNSFAQEQPKPKKDTVNIDTDAKPTFYYAAEDDTKESGGSPTSMVIIAGVVIIAAAAGFFLLKKKK